MTNYFYDRYISQLCLNDEEELTWRSSWRHHSAVARSPAALAFYQISVFIYRGVNGVDSQPPSTGRGSCGERQTMRAWQWTGQHHSDITDLKLPSLKDKMTTCASICTVCVRVVCVSSDQLEIKRKPNTFQIEVMIWTCITSTQLLMCMSLWGEVQICSMSCVTKFIYR